MTTTLVQQFAAYCEENRMPSDETGSVAFFVNSLQLRSGRVLTTDERDDLLDFVSPDVVPGACPLR